MKTNQFDITKLPTVFRGCQWSDGWEFDAPAVVYFPAKYKRYGFGGNSSAIDEIVEEITDSIEDGDEPDDGGLAEECEWRGWGRRFNKRTTAQHVQITVEWLLGSDGRITATVIAREERNEPFARVPAAEKKGGAG